MEEGAIYALVGPSGCGKSTLLKSICGIVTPESGSVTLKGTVLNTKTDSIGYIPQQYGLLNWLKVKDNLILPGKVRKTKNREATAIVEQLRLTNLLERYPAQLSGGEKQRVALARAWIMNPDLLLMDEPFSSLDAFTAKESIGLFRELWKDRRTTTLWVTHQLSEAVENGTYIVLLAENPCRILQIIENPYSLTGRSSPGNRGSSNSIDSTNNTEVPDNYSADPKTVYVADSRRSNDRTLSERILFERELESILINRCEEGRYV